ncbi:ROK family protein [Nocardioides sp. R-C-SC26]|uniref:ROK family protein n=1 Tax=Nocardioides sp. R-C-SC26 TaxID=2870414 RepID=UPI001E35B753|nr:ROK family protein [Nocardioides sp. R-C-SC26]
MGTAVPGGFDDGGVLVGVDIGGTKVLAGEVVEGRVVRTATHHTPGRRVAVSLVEDALTAAVEEVAGGRRVRAVGLAAAGFVDAAAEHVVFAPHLPWTGDPVRARLADRWKVPVALDNDATCAAVAEAELGAARGVTSAVVITLGTGIGGGLVLDGRVWRGAGGMAGEFGHQQVVPDGRACECGQSGCWEQYCSGSALVRFARKRVGVEPTRLTELCGGQPDQLTGPMVTMAAEEGDLVARQAFGAIGEWPGIGIAGLVAASDPALVVVGGGVSAAGDRLLAPARATLAERLVGGRHRTPPPVVPAALGPSAGLIGAAVLADRSTSPSR